MNAIFSIIPKTGPAIFASLGPMIKIPKIAAITLSEWLIQIPKSAFLNTMRNKSTTTPTVLFPSPKILPNAITNAVQKSRVIPILNI